MKSQVKSLKKKSKNCLQIKNQIFEQTQTLDELRSDLKRKTEETKERNQEQQLFFETLKGRAQEVNKKPQYIAQATGLLGEKRRRTTKINRFIRSQSDLLNGIRQQRAHTQLGKYVMMFQYCYILGFKKWLKAVFLDFLFIGYMVVIKRYFCILNTDYYY